MMEASNLGQIIGRARYGLLEMRPQPELVAAAEAARRAEVSRLMLERERAAREDKARQAQARELEQARKAAFRAEIGAADIARREFEKLEANRAAMEAKRAAAPAVKRSRRGRAAELEALLKAHPGGLNMAEIKQALGIATHTAVEVILRLPLERLGRRRHYVYRLKKGA